MKQNDRIILRSLAEEYRVLANDPVNTERRERCRGVNDLKCLRPPVWIDEIPWHEMNFDGSLTLLCEEEPARRIEQWFRRQLFRGKYFPVDTVFEPFYPVPREYEIGSYGADIREERLSTDAGNNIVSHRYEDLLSTFEDLEQLHLPRITARPERTKAHRAAAEEAFGDLLPAVEVGGYPYAALWDDISMRRGVEPVFIDMAERPELIHATMEKMTEIYLSIIEGMERVGALDPQPLSLHCTPGYTSVLPQGHGPARLKESWYRAMAQPLSSVSPAMFREFELDYQKRLFERCGLVYYGCCEPLDRVLEDLMKIPNMRKLGVSPWANADYCMEAMDGRFVAACKPNPALVAGSLNENAIRREIRKFVDASGRYSTPCDLVLKDISTVTRKPENLIRWAQIAMEETDR